LLENYRWSSLGEYLNPNSIKELCQKEIILEQFGKTVPIASYRKFINSKASFKECSKIKKFIFDHD